MLRNTLTVTESANSRQADIIKVAATSRSAAVAGAIAGIMRKYRHVEVHAIGAGAINQAVKALALARIFLDEDGISLLCVPKFLELVVDGKRRTAVRFCVESRQ